MIQDKCKVDNCKGLCCTQIENLSVKLPDIDILNNINIHIHCGQFTAIIGPNGAGKSTLLKAILGEIKYTGALKFCSENDNNLVNPRIGYVPQKLKIDGDSPCSVFDLFLACTSRSPVCFSKNEIKKKFIIDTLRKVQAHHLANRRIASLSGGELQRILLGLALIPVPNLLLLDEPMSGVDKKGTDLFYSIVSDIRKKFDLSIIMVSHDLDQVRTYADKVILLNKTILCQGRPEYVFENSAFKKTFSYKSLFDLQGGGTND